MTILSIPLQSTINDIAQFIHSTRYNKPVSESYEMRHTNTKQISNMKIKTYTNMQL